MHLPKLELDKFDGNPLEYLTFIAVFDEVVDTTVMDGQLKLYRIWCGVNRLGDSGVKVV